jgi:hypothetical protein
MISPAATGAEENHPRPIGVKGEATQLDELTFPAIKARARKA